MQNQSLSNEICPENSHKINHFTDHFSAKLALRVRFVWISILWDQTFFLQLCLWKSCKICLLSATYQEPCLSLLFIVWSKDNIPFHITGFSPPPLPTHPQSTVRKKMAAVCFTTIPCEPTKSPWHIERYGLRTVVPILTALLLSSLNELQYFFVFLYALLEFWSAKHYR